MSNHWIGVDLGGTKILAGLFDDQFRLLARSKHSTDVAHGGPAVFEQIHAAVEDLFTQTGVDRASVRGRGPGHPRAG